MQVTEQEVEEAIKKLNSDSAPGLDGLTSNFYKAHANFFIPYLTNTFNLMTSHNCVPESFTRTVIKLIPKKPVSRTVEDYRPITLINTDQKILSHLLANRLKKVPDHSRWPPPNCAPSSTVNSFFADSSKSKLRVTH